VWHPCLPTPRYSHGSSNLAFVPRGGASITCAVVCIMRTPHHVSLTRQRLWAGYPAHNLYLYLTCIVSVILCRLFNGMWCPGYLPDNATSQTPKPLLGTAHVSQHATFGMRAVVIHSNSQTHLAVFAWAHLARVPRCRCLSVLVSHPLSLSPLVCSSSILHRPLGVLSSQHCRQHLQLRLAKRENA